MLRSRAKNRNVNPLARRANLDGEFRLAVSRGVAIPPDECLLNVLADILLGCVAE